MLHTFSVNGSQLAASLKDATCYAGKDAYDPGTASIVMANAHKTNQLSVIACDGKGYYEIFPKVSSALLVLAGCQYAVQVYLY